MTASEQSQDGTEFHPDSAWKRSSKQPDALIIQIYSVIKLYMFREYILSIIRSYLLYIRHW